MNGLTKAVAFQSAANTRMMERAEKHSVAVLFAAKIHGAELNDQILAIIIEAYKLGFQEGWGFGIEKFVVNV